MKLPAMFSILTWFAITCALADENSDEKIWYSSDEQCIASRDTVGITTNEQTVVVIRYSYERYDSLDCFVLTRLPNVENLQGTDFFYNFVASFLVRSMLWANSVVNVLNDRMFQPEVDNVWADVEGAMIDPQQHPNVQSIVDHHGEYRNQYEAYYQNAQMDSLLIRHTIIGKRPDDGWLHFVIRAEK